MGQNGQGPAEAWVGRLHEAPCLLLLKNRRLGVALGRLRELALGETPTKRFFTFETFQQAEDTEDGVCGGCREYTFTFLSENSENSVSTFCVRAHRA